MLACILAELQIALDCVAIIERLSRTEVIVSSQATQAGGIANILNVESDCRAGANAVPEIVHAIGSMLCCGGSLPWSSGLR